MFNHISISLSLMAHGPYSRVQTSLPWYDHLTVHATASTTVQLLPPPWVRGVPHFIYVYPPTTRRTSLDRET